MSERLEPGQKAPDFTLTAHDRATVALGDLLDGKKAIVYFYPAAMTPGCTTQACDFRDSIEALAGEGFNVVGISPDNVDKLAKFVERDQLTFPLLSDEDHAVAESYGAWGLKKNYGREYEGLIRSTIVINQDGTVELAQYNVRAKGHVAKLRRDLKLD